MQVGRGAEAGQLGAPMGPVRGLPQTDQPACACMNVCNTKVGSVFVSAHVIPFNSMVRIYFLAGSVMCNLCTADVVEDGQEVGRSARGPSTTANNQSR